MDSDPARGLPGHATRASGIDIEARVYDAPAHSLNRNMCSFSIRIFSEMTGTLIMTAFPHSHFARVARPYSIGCSLSLLPAFATGMIHIGVATSAELRNVIKDSSSEISLLTPRNASLAESGSTTMMCGPT